MMCREGTRLGQIRADGDDAEHDGVDIEVFGEERWDGLNDGRCEEERMKGD